MLAEALLSVPREIYSHSPRRYLEAHSRAFSSKCYHFSCLDSMKATAVTAAGGSNVVRVEAGSGSVFGSVVVKEVSARCGLGVESVSSKYQLILAVLQCLRSEASLDSSSPDFVPSVFVYTTQCQNLKAKLERYHRKRRRDDRPITAANLCVPSKTLKQECSMDHSPAEDDIAVTKREFDDLNRRHSQLQEDYVHLCQILRHYRQKM
ncbi:hypothetical protein UPYG_G00343860 [Umbra pygmaea]|uniref:Uncharacterized protein n=1 Tax=Umbra pygmaea TaxID=75934 RepID=A0ABD0WDQ6_UMBPY